MKKIIATATYSLFGLLVLILVFSIGGLYESTSGWNSYEHIFGYESFFSRTGTLEGLILFLTVATVTFWLGNSLIQKINRIKQPVIIDHLRQSIIFYCLFIGQVPMWLPVIQEPTLQCQHDCQGIALFSVLLLTPLFGIIINALYLFRLRRINLIKRMWSRFS